MHDEKKSQATQMQQKFSFFSMVHLTKIVIQNTSFIGNMRLLHGSYSVFCYRLRFVPINMPTNQTEGLGKKEQMLYENNKNASS